MSWREDLDQILDGIDRSEYQQQQRVAHLRKSAWWELNEDLIFGRKKKWEIFKFVEELMQPDNPKFRSRCMECAGPFDPFEIAVCPQSPGRNSKGITWTAALYHKSCYIERREFKFERKGVQAQLYETHPCGLCDITDHGDWNYELYGDHIGPNIMITVIEPWLEADEDGWSPAYKKIVWTGTDEEVDDDLIDGYMDLINICLLETMEDR